MSEEIRIGFFGEFETKEIICALNRLIKNIMNKKIKICQQPYDLIIIDLKKKENGESPSQDKFIEFLINENIEELPYCIILGAEKNLEIFNSKKYGRISEIQLFTELCPEYYQYISIPFNIEELLSFFRNFKKNNKKQNPFKCFKNTRKQIEEKFKNFNLECFKGDNKKIFKEAGKCCLEEYRKEEMRVAVHKGKEEEKDLEIQIYEFLIATILKAKENKPLNFVIIEDNLEGVVYKDKEDKDKKLCDILELFKDILNIEFWLLDDFEGLKKFLIKRLHLLEIGEKKELEDSIEIKKIKNDGKAVIKMKNKTLKIIGEKEVDIDCIIIDILLIKNNKFYDGIEILNLLTNTFPEIPTLILSKSSEGVDITYAFEKGISYYILKSRTLTLPYYYYQHLNDLGKIISFIK